TWANGKGVSRPERNQRERYRRPQVALPLVFAVAGADEEEGSQAQREVNPSHGSQRPAAKTYGSVGKRKSGSPPKRQKRDQCPHHRNPRRDTRSAPGEVHSASMVHLCALLATSTVPRRSRSSKYVVSVR